MPRRCATDPRLPGLIAAQDHLLHRDQALAAGLTPRAIGHRLQEGQWRLLLPDVYLTHPGEPSRRQQPATAVVAATRRMTSRRSVLAAFSEAAQRRIVTVEELRRAHIEGPPRNSRFGDAALAALTAGTRSAPEEDFRRLVGASSLLPPAEFNVWLRLPGGRVVCADALFHSSAVIHETNGRRAHAREDLFEDMQERHDALTAAGFVVLHNSPRRLREHAREVVAQVERCHLKYEGRGLPEGVEVLPIAA